MNWSTATAATRRTSPGSRPFSARNLRIHILGPGGRRATLSATSTPSSTRRLTSSTPSRRILKCIPISWMARGASRCWNRSWHRRNRRGGRKSLQSGKQMKTIKAGIIGTGFIGPADREISVVHNCTPNHLHFAISKQIMAAGKHVISEKPLAMTTAESRELVKLAARAGVVNATDFNYRYYPLVQEAKAMVASGKLGEVFHANGSYTQDWLYLNTDWNWRLVPKFSGKSRAVADVGSHWCDCIQFISGHQITKVLADLRTIHKTRMKPKKEVETYSGKMLQPSDYEPVKINTEDYANVLFEFDNGAGGSFTVSQCFAGRKNRLFYEF